MPRFERLNEKTQRPNTCINFIKPLPGPNYDTAHDFLSRVAAIAAPITRTNHLSVMTIEEFEPNKEFWGRNFNAGECIQLVLKSPSTGRWLPFRFVQMVFMHELAHCTQMNHSRAFWAVRNAYSEELKQLWSKGYIGDGLWGRGRSLYDGQLASMDLPAADGQLVAHLCGGSYKGLRGRGKRAKKDRPKESYAEAKQRRIKKKFGEGGEAIGDDEETRMILEGKSVKGKPRVAKSNRGRELRAAAALARFATDATLKKEEDETETEGESDFEEKDMGPQAKGPNGENMVDSKGNRLIRVCEGEDAEGDAEARREMDELGAMSTGQPESDDALESSSPYITIDEQDEEQRSLTLQEPPPLTKQEEELDSGGGPSGHQSDCFGLAPATALHGSTSSTASSIASETTSVHVDASEQSVCSICSLENDNEALTCAACAHVLHPDRLHYHWSCGSEVCKESFYINAGDSGVCGVCGAAKT